MSLENYLSDEIIIINDEGRWKGGSSKCANGRFRMSV